MSDEVCSPFPHPLFMWLWCKIHDIFSAKFIKPSRLLPDMRRLSPPGSLHRSSWEWWSCRTRWGWNTRPGLSVVLKPSGAKGKPGLMVGENLFAWRRSVKICFEVGGSSVAYRSPPGIPSQSQSCWIGQEGRRLWEANRPACETLEDSERSCVGPCLILSCSVPAHHQRADWGSISQVISNLVSMIADDP